MAQNYAQGVLPVHDPILKLSIALLLVGIWWPRPALKAAVGDEMKAHRAEIC